MKKYLTRISCFAILVMAASFLFVGCDENDKIDPPGPEDEMVLEGELTTEKTLKAGETYELVGGYQVRAGGNLIIEAGVTIVATRTIDGQPDYILVEQGGKINANGTMANPIVMTSNKKEPGAWGGVHICGSAPINLSGGTGKSEIGAATFGGNNPSDNSGVMRYVRMEYTGFTFTDEKESNGLTMYGVGNGTTIEYIQVYKGSDDGFEWFGGTVNVKYLVSTYSEDDSFDWTDGWVGKGQFLVAIQDQTAPGADGTANGDCLIEADNRENNFVLTPVSYPTLANLTLVGNNDTNAQKRGIRLRAGTYVKMYNVLVAGKPNSVTTATAETEKSFLDGKSVIEYLVATNGFTYENGAALALDTKTGNAANQVINLTNGYVGAIDGGKDLSFDSFFTRADYKGAVPANNDWTEGWTIRDDYPEQDNPELKGELRTERVLKTGKTYQLIGGYQVKEGGLLVIEPGVTIEATRSIDGQPDYIIVEQGGKINANGTNVNPIVMTSTRKEPGSWGGVHICGKAPINLSGGTGISEIGDATFGGNDPSDNSGVMRYVRMEYTGFAFSEVKESNGLTMYGVGDGTTIEYIQTYKGSDDGFEWFGGTVNAKYLVSTHSEDDSFDWTDGWVGKGQFWVAFQDQTAPGADGTANGDCLIEADNREDNFKNIPVSYPTLSNLTLVGNNDTNAQKRGVRLRAGTYVKMYNTLVIGKPNSVTTATAETEQSFLDGKSVIEYLAVDKGFTYEGGADLALDTKTGNGINQIINFTNGYIGTLDGAKDLSADNFFVKTAYKGAVSANNDWTAGWTKK